MLIHDLVLINFRNVSDQKITFGDRLNIIYGRNGQGKTSLLEAIYLLAITRSFRTHQEKIILQHSKSYFDVRGTFNTKNQNVLDIRFYFSNDEGKNLFLNKNKVGLFSKYIGTIPVILLSLDDLELTYGMPANRRRFLDILLSQISSVYLQSLQFYRKSILQRNKLLSDIGERKVNSELLEPWNEQLIKYGSEIIYFRSRLTQYLNEHLSGYYRDISGNDETISVQYKNNILNEVQAQPLERIKEAFAGAIEHYMDGDIERQNTYPGPHRDDLLFMKDDHIIKAYGSQGENKTFLIALKFAEGRYIKETINENPILLMDDIFGELDKERIQHLANKVATLGQTFITTTLQDKFNSINGLSPNFIHIENGCVVYE